MEIIVLILIFSQFIFTIVVGIYFYINLKGQVNAKKVLNRDFKDEIQHIKDLRKITLTKPLSEKTRPKKFKEIIGQEKGINALKAALCGSNPQHVIIYGPPGVGKTAAGRIILDYAINSNLSPFKKGAPFVEIDATILQFDERSIADPLIGSVHDPIYQGSGLYGQSGIPQVKEGAVTKAHGGVLFIDEIGELQNIQMNKLLKVLEDRKVIFNSSYYNKNDNNIPTYIHDIFQNGMPADFRLIGATTRHPDEIPLALRSRCTEIYFRSLKDKEIQTIAENAFKRSGIIIDNEILELIGKYCENGRETVNLVQMAVSISRLENKKVVSINNIEEVIEYGRYSPKSVNKVRYSNKVGIVNGLALYNLQNGTIMEIEVITENIEKGEVGVVQVTGIALEEEINNANKKIIRQSAAKGSIDNALVVLNKYLKINSKDYHIYVNFPGGIPVDGPSAGVAILTALYSSIKNEKVSYKVAMTGEINLNGEVLAVGGVPSKIEAAIDAGIKVIYIPKSSWQSTFNKYKVKIVCIDNVVDLINKVFKEDIEKELDDNRYDIVPQECILTAESTNL